MVGENGMAGSSGHAANAGNGTQVTASTPKTGDDSQLLRNDRDLCMGFADKEKAP